MTTETTRRKTGHPKYVKAYTAGNHEHVYFRRKNWPKETPWQKDMWLGIAPKGSHLPIMFNTPDFNWRYQSALNGIWLDRETTKGDEPTADAPRERVVKRTVKELILAHYQSVAFANIPSKATKRNRKQALDRFCRMTSIDEKTNQPVCWGDLPTHDADGDMMLTRAKLQGLLTFPDRFKASIQRNMKRELTALFAWAVAEKLVPENPVLGLETAIYVPVGQKPWTKELIDQFEGTWPLGTKWYLALHLFYDTAARVEDVAEFGPANVYDGEPYGFTGKVIVWFATKSETRSPDTAIVAKPITPELQAALDLLPPGQKTFLIDGHRKAYTPENLSKSFGKACAEANIPEAHRAHAFRENFGEEAPLAAGDPFGLMAGLGQAHIDSSKPYFERFNRIKASLATAEKVNAFRAEQAAGKIVKLPRAA